MTLPILMLDTVKRAYGTFEALKGISLEIQDGEFLAIVGPSGSGKSTLIKLLVGMDEPTGGNILLRNKVLNGMPANKRPTCMVFQSLALFPHMTVGENIEYPMKIAKKSHETRRKRATELLEMLRLPVDYYDRAVSACSGGEKQRVALARALAYDPEILFFDEPLSALDYRLKKNLEKELKRLHETTGKTFVYITHSLEEAMVMADRIAIMRSGLIEQVDTPDRIYSHPKNAFVAEFMGDVNLIRVDEMPTHGLTTDSDDPDSKYLPEIEISPKGRDDRLLMVRPEVVRFLDMSDHADVRVKGRLAESFAFGSRIQYVVKTDSGLEVLIENQRGNEPKKAVDGTVECGFDWADTHIVSDDVR